MTAESFRKMKMRITLGDFFKIRADDERIETAMNYLHWHFEVYCRTVILFIQDNIIHRLAKSERIKTAFFEARECVNEARDNRYRFGGGMIAKLAVELGIDLVLKAGHFIALNNRRRNKDKLVD